MMEFTSSKNNLKDAGVFELLSELCTKTASKYCTHNRLSQRRLSNKMRSHSYEIILRKTSNDFPTSSEEPIVDLLSYNFVLHHGIKNIAEYKRAMELKEAIKNIRQTDFGDSKENIYNVLRLLVGLSNSVEKDLSMEMFQKPFSFGLLDEMLPKPQRELFGSPQPYSYFPSHVFELPFLIKQGAPPETRKSQTYTDYTVESFESKSKLCIADTKYSQMLDKIESRGFRSPMSFTSMSSTHANPYSDDVTFNYPRLTAPRDLTIPRSESPNVKISIPSSDVKQDIQEVYRALIGKESLDIWELAPNIDKDIPDNIWEIVAKMPHVNERQLIASSSREMKLWQRMHDDVLSNLNVVTERQFIRHIMYLTIGIETKSFLFNEAKNCFYMKENLVLEGISKEHIAGYVSDPLLVGTYYHRLQKYAFSQCLDEDFYSNGLVYEAAREVVRRYLLDFRLKATSIFEEFCKSAEDVNCMPTLLQILYHLEPLKYEIETVASIYKMIDVDYKTTLPHGAELMSYLFNEISLVTHQSSACTMFNSLFSVCKVYFKFIERFIFEGELDDRYNEFFIRKDMQYVNCRSKRYWDKGFHITQSMCIPEFLRALAKFILLCGKSLRLLKLCNPSDPLILLISSDHPSVKCCASFEELERQQQLLDVYRTRCLFVTGELVTFDQILLKREAERKAFAEMATLKQADTMEKIIADRKRLAQLIIAEKQHSLRVLEAAMAEAKAAKQKAKFRERKRYELEAAGDKATEEVDSRLRDDERVKIMEYYSKLNMEVEKKQIHTEWKIKRLQLDQSRMQLLSTEERNLKREKLELEHKISENMAKSTQSMESKPVDELDNKDTVIKDEENKAEDEEHTDKMTESVNSIVMVDVEEKSDSQLDLNKKKSQSSSDVLSAICSVAKSFFGVTKSDDKVCDNKRNLDSQGNIVSEENCNMVHTTSSGVIGANINEVVDNEKFLTARHEAAQNKFKVMNHEFGQLGNEIQNEIILNTATYDIPCMSRDSFDVNLNKDWTPFLEAKRNKLKVLGDEFNLKSEPVKAAAEPRTDAQREALVNRQKILAVEYNLPLDAPRIKEPANVAQEEAIRNKKRVLTSEHETRSVPASPRRESAKRSGLTLNLKPYGQTSTSSGTTPNAPVTPGELFPGLDLETPTTADVPLEGAITSDIFTPRSEFSKDLDTEKPKHDKEFLSTDGFNFPMLDDVTGESETISDVQTEATPDNSPSKTLEIAIKERNKYSFFNLLDGSYNLDEFDPFGVKDLTRYSKDYFSSKMDIEMSSSCYTHPSIIMEEVKKPPYSNIFACHLEPEEEKEQRITCNNIATLTACLQRSVMLPLTYQLEVVNNSILTYFLVNLDMYEHLRSLKDYFFLMDGEFSRSICHNLFTKLTKTLNPQELLNFATLHNILDKALGSSISHVHKFSENLSFTIADTPLSFQHSTPDVLQCLSLTYTVSWPLNIILSQEALQRYAKVFQFLIKMRRIFWVLGEDFENLKLAVKLSRDNSRKLLRSPQYTTLQTHRHIMASMIRALDNYIVTTCILVSWTEFENDLKKARTLDDLYECHVVYIKKVLFRCLLNNRSTPVMKLLNDMFTVILKFSRVLKAGEWEQKEPNGCFIHTSFAQLDELFHLFEKLAKYLHKVVTKLMECGYQRHLVELLTMINLNGFYDQDKSKEEHNVSSQSTYQGHPHYIYVCFNNGIFTMYFVCFEYPICRHCCKRHDHGVIGVVRVDKDLDLRAYETAYPHYCKPKHGILMDPELDLIVF